jgi:hypothetical protein
VKHFRRISVVLAALALLVVSTGFLAHLHKPDAQTGGAYQDHCDLCLQFDRVAGAAPSPVEVAQGVRYSIAVVIAGAEFALSFSFDRAHPARAPPRS